MTKEIVKPKFPFFDTEAVMAKDLPESCLEVYLVPKTLKKQEALDNHYIKWLGECPKKYAVDPWTAEIVCIEFLLPNGQFEGVIGDEKACINLFWDMATRDYQSLGGFNILGYDIPLILVRSMVHNITPKILLNLDKYRTPYVDVMQRLSRNGAMKFKSLDWYCGRLGLGSKNDDPSEVPEMVRAGDYERIRKYCRNDVMMTAKLFKKTCKYFN